MKRYLLGILSPSAGCLLGALLLLVLVFAGLFGNAVVNRDPDEGFLKAVIYAALCAFSLWLVYKGWLRQLWRFQQATRGFETLSGPRLVLRFDPVLRQRLDLAPVLNAWQQALDELTARFGFALKRTPIVYLFSSSEPVNRISGSRSSAWALPGNDIVLATTSDGTACHLSGELARHELGHLFAHTWNRLPAPFLQEGLSSWLEATRDGKPMDLIALAILLAGDELPLLGRLFNWAGDERSYTVAGSFTGFLIRRFGWEKFRTFYGQASGMVLQTAVQKSWGNLETQFEQTVGAQAWKKFVVAVQKFGLNLNPETQFEQTFGLNLLEADRQWRADLRQRQAEFGPDLDVEVNERRAQEAYYRWRLHDCLAEYDRLRSAGRAGATVCNMAARSHLWLWNYAAAAAVLEESLARDKDWERQDQAEAWLTLGRCHDLCDDRARAVQAYQHALEQLDSWDGIFGSTHAQAQRGLQEPFRESDYLQRLKQWARSSG